MRIVISVKGKEGMDRYDIAEAIRLTLWEIEGLGDEGGFRTGIVKDKQGDRIGYYHYTPKEG